jgi:hypothetical protein
MPKPRSAKPQPPSVKDALAAVAKVEKGVIGTATRAAERAPAPVDVVESSLLFASRILREQRDALVPLLQGVGPKTRTGKPALRPAAEAVKAAFDLAESVVETQRQLLRGLLETVTPPLARHADDQAKAVTATGRRTPARRTPVRPARKKAS